MWPQTARRGVSPGRRCRSGRHPVTNLDAHPAAGGAGAEVRDSPDSMLGRCDSGRQLGCRCAARKRRALSADYCRRSRVARCFVRAARSRRHWLLPRPEARRTRTCLESRWIRARRRVRFARWRCVAARAHCALHCSYVSGRVCCALRERERTAAVEVGEALPQHAFSRTRMLARLMRDSVS